MTTENLVLKEIDNDLLALAQKVKGLQEKLNDKNLDSYEARRSAHNTRSNLNAIIAIYNLYLNEVEQERLRMKKIETSIMDYGDTIDNIYTHILPK